ncbi:Lipid phosphate phosphatase [Musa troglodytarum]|uniref:Lipid phosphate phosphatase n=1 Tax=Musa troglodytarum TaxID=320322 RepID=A0A9E7FCM0_9LILI|nr:Lipid phosphate phosphatase [Musa troglodytarum]
MADIQLGSHTVKSHGVKVAKFHMHDWIILLLLGVIEIILNVIEPFHRFVGKDMMTDLKYPLKSNTVPFWAVPMIGIVLPLVIFLAIYYRRRDVYDLHHAILDAIKDGVGRPRPDFFWRCFPDGKEDYDNVTTNVRCHGEHSVIKEGHKSFPSGHSSWSFAGLGFLSWYLAGKIQAFDRRGHVAKLCIVFLPLLLASLVAISRVDDYWHHWQDVFAGGLLVLSTTICCKWLGAACIFPDVGGRPEQCSSDSHCESSQHRAIGDRCWLYPRRRRTTTRDRHDKFKGTAGHRGRWQTIKGLHVMRAVGHPTSSANLFRFPS